MALEDNPDFRVLPDKDKKFIYHLLKGRTAKEAYKLTHPTATKRSCETKGSQLRQKYKHFVEESLSQGGLLEGVNKRVVENLVAMAFADTGELLDEQGRPRSLKDIPPNLRRCITEFEIDGEHIRYKLTGKLKSLETLAKITRLTENSPAVQVEVITESQRDAKLDSILVNALKREQLELPHGQVIVKKAEDSE